MDASKSKRNGNMKGKKTITEMETRVKKPKKLNQDVNTKHKWTQKNSTKIGKYL